MRAAVAAHHAEETFEAPSQVSHQAAAGSQLLQAATSMQSDAPDLELASDVPECHDDEMLKSYLAACRNLATSASSSHEPLADILKLPWMRAIKRLQAQPQPAPELVAAWIMELQAEIESVTFRGSVPNAMSAHSNLNPHGMSKKS
jgi:hypothetical protein